MVNKPKRKGTAGETELKGLLEEWTGRKFRRTAPGCKWDLETVEDEHGIEPINILATRPDRGQWLLTMTPGDWQADLYMDPIHVEVKRYARFALHKTYADKFGGPA